MNRLKAEKIIAQLIEKTNCNRKVAEKILVAHINLGLVYEIIEVVEKLLPDRNIIIGSHPCGCGAEDCENLWIEVDGVNVTDLVWDIVNEKEITPPLTPLEFKNKIKKEIKFTPASYGIEVLHLQTDNLMEELLISLGYSEGIGIIRNINRGYN